MKQKTAQEIAKYVMSNHLDNLQEILNSLKFWEIHDLILDALEQAAMQGAVSVVLKPQYGEDTLD